MKSRDKKILSVLLSLIMLSQINTKSFYAHRMDEIIDSNTSGTSEDVYKNNVPYEKIKEKSPIPSLPDEFQPSPIIKTPDEFTPIPKLPDEFQPSPIIKTPDEFTPIPKLPDVSVIREDNSKKEKHEIEKLSNESQPEEIDYNKPPAIDWNNIVEPKEPEELEWESLGYYDESSLPRPEPPSSSDYSDPEEIPEPPPLSDYSDPEPRPKPPAPTPAYPIPPAPAPDPDPETAVPDPAPSIDASAGVTDIATKPEESTSSEEIFNPEDMYDEEIYDDEVLPMEPEPAEPDISKPIDQSKKTGESTSSEPIDSKTDLEPKLPEEPSSESKLNPAPVSESEELGTSVAVIVAPKQPKTDIENKEAEQPKDTSKTKQPEEEHKQTDKKEEVKSEEKKQEIDKERETNTETSDNTIYEKEESKTENEKVQPVKKDEEKIEKAKETKEESKKEQAKEEQPKEEFKIEQPKEEETSTIPTSLEEKNEEQAPPVDNNIVNRNDRQSNQELSPIYDVPQTNPPINRPFVPQRIINISNRSEEMVVMIVDEDGTPLGKAVINPQDNSYTFIDDERTPLGTARIYDNNVLEILGENIPKSLPKTGQEGNIIYYLLGLGMISLAALLNKKIK